MYIITIFYIKNVIQHCHKCSPAHKVVYMGICISCRYFTEAPHNSLKT